MTERREFGAATAYVLGGNEQTLAYTASLQPENGIVTAILASVAWTPAGVAIGTARQRVGIPADGVGTWIDRTFPASDEHAFVSNARDLDLLLRTAWRAPAGDEAPLSDRSLVNPEDVPEDILDGLSQPAADLVNCAVCRRLCVRDEFVWNERQLCAWDYHSAVFGRRGPWRNAPYDDHLFETLPRVPYVSTALLDELKVEAVLATGGLEEETVRKLVNTAIDPDHSYMAVRTDDGLTLLRERPD
jgi:hypothetical protein